MTDKSTGITTNTESDNYQLSRYFSSRYPVRNTKHFGLFRRGEAARYKQLQTWLPNVENLNLLDAGCGDGHFFATAVAGNPRSITLADLVQSNVENSMLAWRERSERIATYTGDIRSMDDNQKFDAVVAMGLCDYHADWANLIESLLARSSGCLILDLPRSDTAHHQIRRIWLATSGIKVYGTTELSLKQILNDRFSNFEVVTTQVNLILRIQA